MSVQVELKVGMIDMSLAQLLTEDHRIIEFPSILLPDDVVSGSIVKLSCERSTLAEQEDNAHFRKAQEAILEKYTRAPQAPKLKLHNYTQTSVVLEWDTIDPGSAELLGLALFKNGQQLGAIPNPERRTSTKLSNLEIDKQYQFQLLLTTSSGVLESNVIDVHTHKMTDLSGLTVCVGSLEGSEFTLEDIETSISHIGCRPLQQEVQLDTTHFICTEPDTNQYVRAQVRSMPIVRPQWLKACEDERRLVEVRQYYLSEDPRLMAPHRTRRVSVATAATGEVSIAEESYVGAHDHSADAQVSNSSGDHPAINVVPPEETSEAHSVKTTGDRGLSDQQSPDAGEVTNTQADEQPEKELEVNEDKSGTKELDGESKVVEQEANESEAKVDTPKPISAEIEAAATNLSDHDQSAVTGSESLSQDQDPNTEVDLAETEMSKPGPEPQAVNLTDGTNLPEADGQLSEIDLAATPTEPLDPSTSDDAQGSESTEEDQITPPKDSSSTDTKPDDGTVAANSEPTDVAATALPAEAEATQTGESTPKKKKNRKRNKK